MVRCNKFTCQVCETKRLKKHLYMSDCNKKICHQCLFTDIIEYCHLKCPFCRVEYDFLKLSKYIEDKKISHKLKSVNNSLFKNIFKQSKNNDEVLKKFNDNTHLCLKVGYAVLDSSYVMLDDNILNLYETFINMLMSLPPFMVSIHKDKNIFLTLNKHYEEFKKYDNLQEIFKTLGITVLGLFDNEKPDFIKVYDTKKTNLKYDLIGNNTQIKKTHDKLTKPKLNFDSLDSKEQYKQCKKYITTLTIVKERQPVIRRVKKTKKLTIGSPITISDIYQRQREADEYFKQLALSKNSYDNYGNEVIWRNGACYMVN